MKESSRRHALRSLPALIAASAFPSLARRFFSMLLGRPTKLLTRVRRAVICSAAPTTVTRNVLLARLPAASLAVTVTIVAPIAKVLPDRGALVVDTPGQLSVAPGRVYVTAAPAGLVAYTVTSGRAERTGAVVSFTVANCVAEVMR